MTIKKNCQFIPTIFKDIFEYSTKKVKNNN